MSNLSKLSKSIIDWYWNYGSKRKGVYALSRGGWLDRVVRISAEHEAVRTAKEEYSKPTMALWGPSQSGKSTLLAQFIDTGAAEDGTGSALSWDPTTPARFCGDNKGGRVAVLNPYNQGADASGCVTRFQLATRVPYPKYPVEIKFASEMEILLSLAVGYLSETEAKNKSGELVQLAPSDLEGVVKRSVAAIPPSAPSARVYALLTEVANVVDILIDMELPRYINLSREWADRRSTILNNDILASSEEAVMRLIAGLFWDDWEQMTGLYRQLHNKSTELAKLFDGKSVYCSVEMAALMLNISSAQYYNESSYVRDLVDSCGVTSLDESSVAITKGQGNHMFMGDVDFALAQGLVSLIIVKLKDSVMRTGSPVVYRMLQMADIVDFPGVANEHKSAELISDDQLNLQYTDENGRRPLKGLTQVMKRGKTASIVVSSARNLNIDVFSLLVRMPAGQQYPAQPRQLMNGIRSWFKSMGKSSTPLARDRELQMNLVLTFSASLVNMVQSSGTGTSGLIGVFDKLKGMGELADPEIVNTFCVNYPQFPDGRLQTETEAELRGVISRISADRHFQKQFRGSDRSLREMADIEADRFGGRVYLFENMMTQLGASKRAVLLEQKEADLEREWTECIAEALPSEGGSGQRTADLERMIEAFEGKDLEIASAAKEILRFKNIDPEVLEVIPGRRKEQTLGFVESQVDAWMEASKRVPLQKHMGFINAEHRSRVLSYFRERIDTKEILSWMHGVSALMARRTEERRECRRLIATYMVKMLFPVTSAHRDERDCVKMLEQIASDSDCCPRETNPHMISVISPFVDTLKKLKDDPSIHDERGEQPGDAQLAQLINN